MAETTADVRRDIELTRARMTDTLQELERRLNVMGVVREHPWPAIAVAMGAGFALSGTRADVKAAAAASTAAHATGERVSRVGPALDDVVARLLTGVQAVLLERADELVDELRHALGGSGAARPAAGTGRGMPLADRTDGAAAGAAPSGSAFSGESRAAPAGQPLGSDADVYAPRAD
ncbi:MAG TPA: DUF3618 domain-containing protein [Gemmatimonadaceae bacterium]|nr:DUF3618 domain-containing protein [Gemmatimonadaceae bacterium]